MSGKEIVVSFVIPSYNRARLTRRIVDNILAYPGEDIEVVVADNASPDDTVQRLREVRDERLVLIENEKNIGGTGNMTESLKYGKGKYLFVALSRDGIIAERIPALIRFLREKEHSVVYCGNDSETKQENRTWRRGKQALKKFGYATLHPTGMIFERERLMKIIGGITPEEAKEKYLYFPHDFWMAEMALNGDAETYGERIRCRVEDEYYRNSVSAFVDPAEDLWFFPKGRILQLEKYMDHLASLPRTDREKGRVLEWIYGREICFCTIVYRNMRRDEETCAHYRTTSREVPVKEMLQAAVSLRDSVKEISGKHRFRLSPVFRARMAAVRAETLGYIAGARMVGMIRKVLSGV